MTKNEIKQYWLSSSEKDMKTMSNLFASGDYHWSLFIGHLAVEKLLKAFYVIKKDTTVPYIHDLLRLAEKADLVLSEDQKDFLDTLTSFNIRARYDDYKMEFYHLCTKEFAEKNIAKIEDFVKWIKAKFTE